MKKQHTQEELNALKMYQSASPELKTSLEEIFGKELFKPSLHTRIFGWEDVAKEYGIDPVSSLPYPDPTLDTNFPIQTYKDGSKSNPVIDKISLNADFKMTWTTRLFNEGKKISYDDAGQEKYYGWFKKRPSGFGFDYVTANYDLAFTCVSPRLSFLSEDDCRHVCNLPEFLKIYNEKYNEEYINK